MRKYLLLVLSALFFYAYGQSVQLSYNGSGNYVYIERTDLRRYDNGKYTGLVNREVRSYITQDANPAGSKITDTYYDGYFYFSENTMHNNLAVLAGLNASIPSRFKITEDGQLVMIEDHGYPSFRSFPSFPKDRIKPGDKWQAKAERVVDPLNKGINTKLPVLVEYTYLKDDVFHGEEVYVISAQWATRYGISYIDYNGDREMKSAQGSHKATMSVSKRTGNALVVRDMVDEIFAYMDGTQVAFKGTISMFTEYPPAVDRTKIYQALEKVAFVDKSELNKAKKEKENQMQGGVKSGSGKGSSKDSSASSGKSDDSGKSAGSAGSDASDSSKGSASSVSGSSASDSTATASSSTSAAPSAPDTDNVSADEKSAAAKTERNTSSQSESKPARKPVQKSKSEKRKEMADTIKQQTTAKDSSSAQDTKAASNNEQKVSVEATEAGIRLTMQNLQFKPDSAELLPGEDLRLDQIAAVLKQVPDQMFLVEGHTASVGNPAGEQRLSEERAASIAQSLIKRGIPVKQFIVKGSGSTKPVATNSTREGKAQNRRVEITILD